MKDKAAEVLDRTFQEKKKNIKNVLDRRNDIDLFLMVLKEGVEPIATTKGDMDPYPVYIQKQKDYIMEG